MADGDILTFVVPVNDDGTAADATLTAAPIVVADNITCCSLGRNRVFVLVVKAA